MREAAVRILLVSDSHGDLDALAVAVKYARERSDMAIFLGDGAADLEGLSLRGEPSPPWTAVRGNMDSSSRSPEAMMLDLASLRIMLTHGHRQGVQYGLGRLVSAARLSGADMAFFGHTHRPCFGTLEGLTLLNPGSLSRPRGPEEGSFALVVIGEDGSVDAEFLSLSRSSRGYKVHPAPKDLAAKPEL